jgi:hypothetical protein
MSSFHDDDLTAHAWFGHIIGALDMLVWTDDTLKHVLVEITKSIYDNIVYMEKILFPVNDVNI